MKRIWILKGLPASGKSSWAKEKVAKSNCSIKRINKDDLRAMLDSSKHSKGNEKFVLKTRDWLIRMALNEGKHVIVDDTNLNTIHEERIKEIAKECNAVVTIKWFDVKPEVCIERDLKRQNSVGAKVIWGMYNTYIKEDTSKNVPEPIKQDESLPHAIICDIDGTIAHNVSRSPYDGTRVDEDLPDEAVIRLVNLYHEHGGEIIFLSGREDSCRMKTLDWIRKYTDAKSFMLLMRRAGDNRKDSIIKKALFEIYVKKEYYIDFVLDDRNQVVELWRSLGLTCLQVADGNF